MFFSFVSFDRNHNPRFEGLSPYDSLSLREYLHTPKGWTVKNEYGYYELSGERIDGYLSEKIVFPKIEIKIGEDDACLIEFSLEGIRVELGLGVLYNDIEEALWLWWYYWKDSEYSGDFKEESKWRVGVTDVGLSHINHWEVT